VTGPNDASQKETEGAWVPAEIIADHVARVTQREPIFASALHLEAAAYDRVGKGFDQLPSDAKSLLGAFLDFVGVSRAKFAQAVARNDNQAMVILNTTTQPSGSSSDLFLDNQKLNPKFKADDGQMISDHQSNIPKIN